MKADKSAPAQATHLTEIRESLGLQHHDFFWVTDSEAVQVATIKNELKENHLPCLAHKLNTVLQTFFDTNKRLCPAFILNMIKSCKGIVTHFKQGFHGDLLPTTLKQSGDTRWNSHLSLFESGRANYHALDNVIDSIDNSKEDIRSLYEQLRCEELDELIHILKVY